MCFFIFPGYKWLFYILLVGWAVTWSFVFKTTKKRLAFFVALLLFAGSLWGLINFTPVQNLLVKKVAAVLSQKLQTKVEIKHVDFSLFNNMLIEGLLVEDKQKDTLLYAGTAKVRITDWFFIKEKATLKYLGLNNTVINLNRTDSVWNYQFLIDYFSSPKKSNSTKKGIEFEFKVVEMENFRLNQIDKWVGKDLKVSVNKFNITADTLDLTKKIFAISNISLDKPVFYQNNYTGNRPSLTSVIKASIKADTLSKYKWNNDGWVMNIKEILINDGSFQNEKETERLPYTDRFDGQHFIFSAITGNLKHIKFIHDTLTVDINLATKEKSGFEIKQLQSNLKFTPDMMEFNNLNLQTNKSRLGNYYAMRYENFNSDMSNFLHNVTLDGKFNNSQLHSDDIAFFAPALKTWNRSVDITGTARGTIDNLVTKNMLIKSGNTIVDGDIALRGLPDINNTFIDFKSNNLTTNYNDLVTIIPALKNITQPRLSQLGNIGFKGNYTGFINDFVTYGNITTNLGSIIADINMKLPENKPATYTGKISSSGFNLGKFINNGQIGKVSLNGNVSGSGFTLKDLNTNFKGNIHELEFSGYNYTNIAVDGSIDKLIFNGHGSVDDPNLKIDNFNGSVSFAGKEMAFNFDALLKKSNLKNLHFTNDDFKLDGHFNLNFTGNNIDKFLGTARVYDATLQHDSTRLSFDSLSLQSFIAGNKKYLSFQTNELEGNVTGNFKILELPDAFKVFLNRYYPSYIKAPKNLVSDQDFSFFIKTKEVNEYVQLIDKRLKGFNNAEFNGNLKLAANELNIKANIPGFEYDKKIFNNLVLESKGNRDTLFTKITTGDIVLNDSLHFPGTDLTIRSQNDISVIQLKTSASKTLSEAELNATVQTLSDGVKIHFSPSSFIINEKKWQLEKDGELTIRKAYIDASEVKFVQGEQEITFSTEMDDVTDKTNVIAKLKKVNIDDFTPFFLKQPRLEGRLTGTVTLVDPFGKQNIEYDATAEDFRLDDKLIGKLNLKGDVNTTLGLVRAKVDADGKLNKFSIDGSYNYKSDTSDNQMNFDFLSERFDLSILNNYLGSIFSDMQGDATGGLKIYGGNGHNYITGSPTITNGSLKVNYTKCKYSFTNSPIIFNPDEIDLGTLQLKDTLNNSGTASGKMRHKFFQDFDFDNLRFETGKMLLLNTTKKDNNQFYGAVIGRALMTLNGPVTDMKMKINGAPSTLDSSHIYLPTGSSRESGTIDYIEFIQFGTEMENIKSRQGTNLLIDMDIAANPACKIDVILDEATGDIIKGQGNGNLKIRVGTTEPITMRGRFDITKGDYTFNFQTFLKKPFKLNRGSIVWNGDPYLANINIEAEYLAENVDMSSISSSNSFKQKGDLKIIALLTGILNKPDIAFNFIMTDNNGLKGDYYAENKLADFKNDKNEMLKQVASLLLINSFISNQAGAQNALSGNIPFTIAANTIGGVVSGWLTGIFNKGLEKATKGIVSTYFDINSSFDLQSSAALLQANVKTGLQFLLNNRLVVLLGGNIDINNSAYTQQLTNKSLITPDITIEYMLTKDGRWRAIGFNRSSIVASDLTGIQRNKTGVKISYRKEFDKRTKEERIRRREEKKKPVLTSSAAN
ncbi:translocation/assembly module TamB domain-containing protein [Ferruginibacter sp.]|nr:translocation/assembly module TamB domain-containing protein [Ferruginibacter sp.]